MKPGQIGCLVLVLGLPISLGLQGVAWLLLWTWFAVPLGAPPIGFWHALALALCTMLARQYDSSRQAELEKRIEADEMYFPKSMAKQIGFFLAVIAYGAALHYWAMP